MFKTAVILLASAGISGALTGMLLQVLEWLIYTGFPPLSEAIPELLERFMLGVWMSVFGGSVMILCELKWKQPRGVKRTALMWLTLFLLFAFVGVATDNFAKPHGWFASAALFCFVLSVLGLAFGAFLAVFRVVFDSIWNSGAVAGHAEAVGP